MGGGYRQRGSSDSRRRRVFFDEGTESGASTSGHSKSATSNVDRSSEEASTSRPLKTYGDPTFLKGMPRWIDLFPRRKRAIAAWTFCAITALLSILLLGLWADSQTTNIAQEPDATDLTWNELRTICSLKGKGTLSENVSSLVLAVTGVLALSVLSLRRHRQDDYRGAYRIWGWTSVICFCLSFSEATGLNQILQYTVVLLTERPLGPDGSGWFAIACLLLGLLFIPRLFLDIWYCRAATFTLACTVVCFSLALYFQVAVPTFDIVLGPFSIVDDSARFAEEAAELTGAAFLFFTPLLFGRFVLMEAEGRISTPSTSEASAHPIATAWKLFRGRVSDKGASKRIRKRREKIVAASDAPGTDVPASAASRPRKRSSKPRKEEASPQVASLPTSSAPHDQTAGSDLSDDTTTSDPSSDQAFEELYREELASRQTGGKRLTKGQKKALRRELRKLLEE